MFFLNLTLPEFLTLLGSLSGVVVALYLLDRVRKRHTVASLRFFNVAERPLKLQHRRRLQQPWSLLLQLLGLALLLLALAQLRLGSPDRSTRDHVLILDTSAWMSARSGQLRLIDKARAAARDYLKLIPSGDRVMLVRADALPTPVTLFESDRDKTRKAIDQSQPGAAALNVDEAIAFATQAQRLRAQRSGEIVFIGAGRISSDAPPPVALPRNLRVIPISGPVEHCGLRKMSVRRSLGDPDVWEIFVAVKNYGLTKRSVPLAIEFGGSPVGTRRFDLNAGAEDNATFQFRTRAAGWLEARLLMRDPFEQDDRAVLELPRRSLLAVTVYSAEPDLLKPVFNAIPGVKTTFLPPARYDANIASGIVLFDRFSPPQPPKTDSIWIEPPAGNSPIRVRTSAGKTRLNRWRSDHALASGLRTKDLELDNAEIFNVQPDDIAVAESEAGPVIVARPGKPKTLVFGFHPVRSALKYELTTPLLFANILRWMEPDIFRSWESTAGTAGTVNVELENEAEPASIRVIGENQKPLPFTVEGHRLRFFSANPGIVRVLTGDREYVYSLTLPQPGDIAWTPGNVRTGLPGRFSPGPSSRDIWQLLAVLGGACFVIEWLLFGRARKRSAQKDASQRGFAWRKAS